MKFNFFSYLNILLVILIVILNFNLITETGGKHIRNKRILIQPGTLWCGRSHKAENCDQLGELHETDQCCKEHDHCPYSFASLKEKNGFKSLQYAAMSHCECDLRFYDCLHENSKHVVDELKDGSYAVWENYQSIQIKCFAHFPCSDEDSKSSAIWKNVNGRPNGTCHNGNRVIQFKDIFDYKKFTEDLITTEAEINKITHMLRNKSESYYILKEEPGQMLCISQFLYYPNLIADMFFNRMKRIIEPNNDESLTTSKTTASIHSQTHQTQLTPDQSFKKVIILFLMCNIAIPIIFILAAFCVLKIVEVFT